MIEFNKERMADLQDELMPMFEDHKEFFAYPSMNASPRWDVYDESERMGVHHFYTAREEDTGKLVGYVSYFTSYDHHFSEEYFGYQDLFFLDESYRKSGTALDLVKYAEDDLVDNEEVTVLTMTLKTRFSSSSLPSSMDYESEEKTYIKYVGDL